MPLVMKIRRRGLGNGEESSRGFRERVSRWMEVVFTSKVWWKAWRGLGGRRGLGDRSRFL